MTKKSVFRAAAITMMAAALTVGMAQSGWAEGDPTFTVSGVVYLDAKPIAGVQVCDYLNGACASTAADGSYTVAVKTTTGVGYPTPCLKIAPGNEEQRGLFAPVGLGSHTHQCENPVLAAAGATVTGKDVHLRSFAPVSGQVVDQAGKPIAGATVDSNLPTATKTDANGRFSTRLGVFFYDDGHLTISADGFEDAARKFSPSGSIGRIVLAKAGDTTGYSISGVVTDAAGRPAVGAKVCVAGGACLTKTNSKGAYFGLLSGRTDQNTAWKLRITTADKRIVMLATYSSVPISTFDTGVNFRLPGIVGVKPVIVGKPKVGARLMVLRGKWAPAPVTTRVQWYANGKKIKGATSPGLKVTKKMVGKVITVKITATKPGYPRVVKVSNPTVKVHR